MAYMVPATAEERRNDLQSNFQTYLDEYAILCEKGKKAAGSRAKKALTVVKKLITAVRKDIQDEVDAMGKKSRTTDAAE